MENNEIIMNEEVMDMTEELANVGPGKGLKVAAGIGLAALVGFGVYKLGKHIYTKIKTKREAIMSDECVCAIEEDFEEVE